MEAKKMYIDGEWVIGSMAKTFDVINPATGEVIDKVYESSVEDTRLAIAAAKRSFYETREWRDKRRYYFKNRRSDREIRR